MASRPGTHPAPPAIRPILPARGRTRRTLLAVAPVVWLLPALLAAACGGGSPQSPIPQVESALGSRDVVDGAARAATTIDVTFDRDFTFAPRTLPLASAFDIYVPSLDGGSSRRVLVDEAEEVPGTPRVVRLSVDQMVPDGSELRVARSLFHRKEEGDIRGTIETDLSPVLAALASGPLVLTDGAVVAAARDAEARPVDRAPAAMRTLLEQHLDARGESNDVRSRALGRYDAMPAEVVPSPKLRAALAALTGTFAEPAIDSLLTAGNCTGKPAHLVAFQVPPEGPELAARVTFAEDGARVVSLNTFLEGERLEHIMPFLVHEAVHCDRVAGILEEVSSTAFDTFFYLHMLAVDPGLAKDGTRATREQNVDAIAMVNSGRRYPELAGVLPSDGFEQVLPGSNSTFTSFAELVAAAYAGVDSDLSPDEPLAQEYVATLAAEAGLPVVSAFNLQYLDQLLGLALDPDVYVDAMAALGLAPSK